MIHKYGYKDLVHNDNKKNDCPICKPEQAIQRVREWAIRLAETEDQMGFMDMHGAGKHILYLLGDIEKPIAEPHLQLKVDVTRKLWKAGRNGLD